MEALKELEQLQGMLGLMSAHSIFSSDPANDHLLSQFLVFMVQFCGDANEIVDKCHAIAEQLVKISTAFGQDAISIIDKNGEKKLPLKSFDRNSRNSEGLERPVVKENRMNYQPLIGLEEMKKAQSTLEDFCRSYFMFHDIDIHKPSQWFKYFPILMFVESYIYKLDIDNERLLCPPITDVTQSPPKCEVCFKDHEMWLQIEPFQPLFKVLEDHELMTERIMKEFETGMEYWRLERLFCSHDLNCDEITIEEALKAIRFKSFDYRILNLLVYGLTNKQVNEKHWKFLTVSELLVEISDDLYDYEEDVVKNNFNILRAYTRLYGSQKGSAMLAKYIAEAEEEYQFLLKEVDPTLAAKYEERCREATLEGGASSSTPFGSWSIPTIISNEEEYRIRVQS